MLLDALLLGASLLGALRPAPPPVLPGLDALGPDEVARWRGRRIGLVTNHTGRTVDGTPAARRLAALGLTVAALFSPEHGLAGTAAAGEPVASGVDPASGLRVESLYGATRKPTPAMLAGLDLLVFDIQDVGVRFYTYVSTMKLAMEAAADAGLGFVVLDRPNPLGGLRVEGPVLEPAFASFVGPAPIALVHGMTVGELARLFVGEGLLAAERPLALEVVPMKGWRRELGWAATGLPWRAPSPNIPTPATAVAYPAMALFEGTNVSEGRGTDAVFFVAGAPWLRPGPVLAELEALALPGVRWSATRFVPRSSPAAPRPKHEGRLCRGIRLELVAPERFEAVRTGLAAVAAVRRHHPDAFRWRDEGLVFDRLLGTDRPRRALERGRPVEAILAAEAGRLAAFRRVRERYLLYP